MKNFIGIISLVFLFSLGLSEFAQAQSQTSQTEGKWIYEKQIGQRRPAPYPHLREADVLWAKKVWRLVDLREKMNHPLYFPTEPKGTWKSLIDVILGEINSGTINAYDATYDEDGSNMTLLVTQNDIDKIFDAGIDTIMVPDPDNPSRMIPSVSVTERSTEEVQQYIVQEIWYFDSKLSSLQVRILGICPVRISDNPETGEREKRRLFWIHYPDFRTTFANHESFNTFNDAKRISYDDLFLQRRFSSFIFAESNVYNNRLVTDYETGRGALLESERIKQEIFNFEQDLWEY
jgi:gliding motility associated protien GldN